MSELDWFLFGKDEKYRKRGKNHIALGSVTHDNKRLGVKLLINEKRAEIQESFLLQMP